MFVNYIVKFSFTLKSSNKLDSRTEKDLCSDSIIVMFHSDQSLESYVPDSGFFYAVLSIDIHWQQI